MAKAKRKTKGKAKGKAKAAAAAGVQVGQRVKVIEGESCNARGLVESISAAGVTVRVHGRLAVTVPADHVQAESGGPAL